MQLFLDQQWKIRRGAVEEGADCFIHEFPPKLILPCVLPGSGNVKRPCRGRLSTNLSKAVHSIVQIHIQTASTTSIRSRMHGVFLNGFDLYTLLCENVSPNEKLRWCPAMSRQIRYQIQGDSSSVGCLWIGRCSAEFPDTTTAQRSR